MGHNVLSHGLILFACLAGMILCLIYQRLSLRLLIAAVGFGGELLGVTFLIFYEEFLFRYDLWTIFSLFDALSSLLVVLGLGLAFADIQARLNRARRGDYGDSYPDRHAPDRRSLPADEDLAPWRSNRENDRDIRR